MIYYVIRSIIKYYKYYKCPEEDVEDSGGLAVTWEEIEAAQLSQDANKAYA